MPLTLGYSADKRIVLRGTLLVNGKGFSCDYRKGEYGLSALGELARFQVYLGCISVRISHLLVAESHFEIVLISHSVAGGELHRISAAVRGYGTDLQHLVVRVLGIVRHGNTVSELAVHGYAEAGHLNLSLLEGIKAHSAVVARRCGGGGRALRLREFGIVLYFHATLYVRLVYLLGDKIVQIQRARREGADIHLGILAGYVGYFVIRLAHFGLAAVHADQRFSLVSVILYAKRHPLLGVKFREGAPRHYGTESVSVKLLDEHSAVLCHESVGHHGLINSCGDLQFSDLAGACTHVHQRLVYEAVFAPADGADEGRSTPELKHHSVSVGVIHHRGRAVVNGYADGQLAVLGILKVLDSLLTRDLLLHVDLIQLFRVQIVVAYGRLGLLRREESRLGKFRRGSISRRLARIVVVHSAEHSVHVDLGKSAVLTGIILNAVLVPFSHFYDDTKIVVPTFVGIRAAEDADLTAALLEGQHITAVDRNLKRGSPAGSVNYAHSPFQSVAGGNLLRIRGLDGNSVATDVRGGGNELQSPGALCGSILHDGKAAVGGANA